MKNDMNERNREAVCLPIDQLYPFVRHPYQVRDDAEMEELAQSIRENGILSPVIVRPLENTQNKYEIVSGPPCPGSTEGRARRGPCFCF